jgi:hypothetical protein
MPTERFDDLARNLARGTLNPQAAFVGLIAGMKGRVRRYLGDPTTPTVNASGTVGQYKAYLPIVRSASCSTASTCSQKHFCSADNTCRCLRSAEGEIRCGQIPSCDVPRCSTSADCAHLGPGYFCDTPNSGCCSDAEEQRCIAPCGATTAPCPPERVCGTQCCAEGETCIDGSCQVESGTVWTGPATYNAETIVVRFVLEEAGDGTLSGRLLMKDPKTGVFLETGTISGTRSGNNATWTTEAGSVIAGTFSGTTFHGTMRFSSIFDEPPITANLTLTVTASVASAALTVDAY